MSKVVFSNEGTDAAMRKQVEEERRRADRITRKLSATQSRIREFYNRVDGVIFAERSTAPRWASDWMSWLIYGDPEPVPAVAGKAVAVEAVMEEQPALETTSDDAPEAA